MPPPIGTVRLVVDMRPMVRALDQLVLTTRRMPGQPKTTLLPSVHTIDDPERRAWMIPMRGDHVARGYSIEIDQEARP